MTDTPEATELLIEPDADYPWAQSVEEQRRCFVFENMATPEIDINILLGNMAACVQWLTEGTLPAKAPKLRAVKE